jgi:hypothetical protein
VKSIGQKHRSNRALGNFDGSPNPTTQPKGPIARSNIEAGLATILASGLAAAVAEHTLEWRSGLPLARVGGLTALQLLVTNVFMKRLWVVSVPYASLWLCFVVSRIKLEKKIMMDEQDHIMLRLLHQAGYSIQRCLTFGLECCRWRSSASPSILLSSIC